jgi:spore germination cell wall hydrolase CwlJ-like protein
VRTSAAQSPVESPAVVSPAVVTAPAAQPTLDELVDRASAQTAPVDRELECMAKAVHHEAANQTLEGQLAVAQLILNRTHSDVFPKTICAVVNQQGQFFSTRSYRAPVRSPNWRTAVAVARVARQQDVAQIVPGALFYHADYVRPSWSHKRTRLAQIGAHIFYR